jgi:predicted DNA-binding transcriptional regulator AlpA
MNIDELLASLEVEKIPAAIAMLAARLLAVNGTHSESQTADRLLNAKQASAIIGCSADWLYDHSAQLPFCVKLPMAKSTKKNGETKVHLRFSERGIADWIRRRAGR